MISRKLFWCLTLVLAIGGFTAGSLIGHDEPAAPQRSSEAVWKEVYGSPSEMVRRVDAVVLAKMVQARPGRVAVSENAADRLPFEVVEFEVIRGFKQARAEGRVLVERAVPLEADGGRYEPNATYLLFLRKQAGTPFYYQVNHQGRYLVAESRLWGTDPADRVARAFEGMPVASGLKLIRESLVAGRR